MLNKLAKLTLGQVFEYVRERFSTESSQLEVNCTTVLKNSVCRKKAAASNLICLITKQRIYSASCTQGIVNFSVVKQLIKRVENIEKYIAKKNDKMSAHERKWRGVQLPPSGTRDIVREYADNLSILMLVGNQMVKI